MKPREILETCLYVDNLQKAEAFYTDILGFERYAVEEERHIFFRCGNRMLLLFLPQTTLKSPDFPSHDNRP